MIYLFHFLILILLSSCGKFGSFTFTSLAPNVFKKNIVISGVVTPFIGSISEDKSYKDFLLNSARATDCTTPVVAKIYKINTDGSIDGNNPLASQEVNSSARYTFNSTELNLVNTTSKVLYVVKVEGCNNDIYKRPVTNFDSHQDLDARTTIVAEVTNVSSFLSKQLNEVERSDVDILINSISGNSKKATFTSLTTDVIPSSKFSQIFGASSSVISMSKPEVALNFPNTAINELALSHFSVSAFHVDPNYSFAYKWKLDGKIMASTSSWNYIPGANSSGSHQIDLYIGQDNGSGNIDLSMPYYTKTVSVNVNNNIFPIAPDISLNASTPSPLNTNSVSINLNTGTTLSNCESFSHLAITESSTPPGIMQFNIDCSISGTQTQTISFSNGDGSKTLYLWAIDNEGMISNAKTVTLILDTLPPTASFGFLSSAIIGGSTQSISFSANDAGVGLSTLDLYLSTNNGTSYSLLSHLATNATTYNWAVPSLDISTANLKLVAVDLTSSTTTVYSNTFAIDSTSPVAPTITRSSNAISSSTTVAINATCIADYYQILYTENSTTPLLSNANWENCASSKNFTVSTGDGAKTIYAFTRDAAGNISSSSNVTMTLDTTPPSSPVATLSSASISSSTTATFTITDCLDRPYVLVSESMIAPLVGDSNWQTCSTGVGAISYILVGPVLEQTHTFYIYAKDSAGNISASTTSSIIYDITNPIINLATSLNLLYKGGDVIPLNFSASDANGLSTLKLEYATDGVTYTLVTTLAGSATSYNWTVPANNTTLAKIRLTAFDNATSSNTSAVSSNTFTIDSTPPTAPSLTLTSSSIASSPNITMTVGSCTDTANILINESSTAPSSGATGWQLCSTTASAMTATVSGEGLHNIYAWAKDLAGNIAISANHVSMTLDTSAPIITVTTPNSLQGNTSTGSVNWTLTETNVAAGSHFTVDIYNGSTWLNIGSVLATTGVNTAQAYSLSSFAVPNVNVATALIRVTLADAAGNSSTSQSGFFTIDSIPPSLSSITINDGATYAGTPLVNIKVNVSDNYSTAGKIKVRFSEANSSTSDCQSEYANTNWSVWTNSTTNIAFNITPTDGVKKICAWVKDDVGNISSLSPTTGTTGVDTNSIQYSTGNPPVVASFSVTKTSGGGYAASLGDPLTITWTATDTEGLDNNPINISYTTDNSTWKDISTNLTIATSANQTWVGSLSGNPTSASGTITTFNAPTSSFFKLKIQAKDLAGNTSSFVTSQVFNTGNWSVYAGTKDRGDGGTGKGAVLTGVDNITLFAINPLNGDIYSLDYGIGIRKLDAKTGLVSTFIKHGTLNLPTSGALPTNPAMIISYYNNIFFDSKGRLYVGQTIGGLNHQSAIYQIDIASSFVRQYAGGGLADDGGASATSLQVASGGFSLDEQDSLYVWTYCGGVAVTGTTVSTVGKRIVKIAQNSDGTPGTTTRIIGDCTLADPGSGNTAISQPASNSLYIGLSKIVAWNNGNTIVVIPYGSARYKILNGIVYSSNINSGGLGTGFYNSNDNSIYRSNAPNIEKITINLSGANGDTTTIAFSSNSTALGCTSDGTLITSYCANIGTQIAIRSGILYFADGVSLSSTSNYAIRYFDSNNQLRTVFGGQPFYGDGKNRSLARGIFSGIYYKKSTEPNLTAFPEGLYFMESAGVVFGQIDPTSGIVNQLAGNQARLSSTPITGTTISKNLTLGAPYFGGNAMPLTFDSTGLPWMKISSDAVSIDATNKIVRRTNDTTSTYLQLAANNANPANYGLYVYSGIQNFTLKGMGLFVMPNYVTTGYDPIISIRYMDFTNSITPIILGGSYLASSNSAASPDIATAGTVAAAPLWTSCRSTYGCYMQYNASNDRLYFVENSVLRYITTATNTTTATLGTLFSASGMSNFAFTPDNSQIWYFKSGGLYCRDISSGKSWCDSATDYFAIRTAAGFAVTQGPNNITFKDNQTMFISTYAGEILQFILPTGP